MKDSVSDALGLQFQRREQIAQCTDRRGLHLAEVVQLALHPEALERDVRPERAVMSLAPAPLRVAERR